MHTEWSYDVVIHGAEIIYPNYTHINLMEKLQVQILILVDIFEILVHKVPNFKCTCTDCRIYLQLFVGGLISHPLDKVVR